LVPSEGREEEESDRHVKGTGSLKRAQSGELAGWAWALSADVSASEGTKSMVGKRKPCFVYGTLMFNQVLRAILGRVPDARPACLESGFRRLCVPNVRYPGMIKATSSEPDAGATHGLLLTDLSDAELAAFDVFEGEAYHLEDVQPRMVENVEDAYGWASSAAHRDTSALQLGPSVDAAAYLWRDPHALRDELWDPHVHFASHLSAWVTKCEHFSRLPEVTALPKAPH
jgi:hypothetical protein